MRAQEGESPLEQQRSRHRFERVCRAWAGSADKWAVVAIRGLSQVDKLLELLESRAAEDEGAGEGEGEGVVPVASRTKTLYLNVVEAKRPTAHTELAKLLARFVNVSSVEIVLDFAAVWDPQRVIGLGEDACAALAVHKGVAHFKIGSWENADTLITDNLLAR